jgi:6-bladed beta-propeller
MSKKSKYLVLGIFAGAWLLCCRPGQDAEITNRQPRHAGQTIGLLKLATIDITKISLFGREPARSLAQVVDFDQAGNLYILDTWESRFWVFDHQGRLVRSFGRPGQGPKEFFRPSMFFIRGDRIYVRHNFSDIKIVDLAGEFVSRQSLAFENPLWLKAVGEDVFLFSGKTDPTFTKLDFILRRFEGGRFERETILSMFPYPPGLQAPNYNFFWWDWLLISPNGEFFFPEDNLNKFSIVQYGAQGKPLRKISRPYEPREYSQASRNRFFSVYDRLVKAEMMKFPPTPPIVRKMFQDQKLNLWVISGESTEDNEEPEFENDVDIFSPKGEWLYSFRTKLVSARSIYHEGRIYTVRTDPATFEQQIDIYNIKY